jgi:hypothetical protein
MAMTKTLSIDSDVFLAGLGPEIPPDPAAEGEAEGQVEAGEQQALPDADLVLLVPVQQPEVEGEQARDQDVEPEPHPQRLAEPFDGENVHHTRDLMLIPKGKHRLRHHGR